MAIIIRDKIKQGPAEGQGFFVPGRDKIQKSIVPVQLYQALERQMQH